MIQDFKFAFRQLIKTPGFTTIAILTLAIAIGVNSAVFALVNGVILRPVVPLRPAEVVNVFTARQGAAHDYRPFSYNEFSALRENNDVFADVGAMRLPWPESDATKGCGAASFFSPRRISSPSWG